MSHIIRGSLFLLPLLGVLAREARSAQASSDAGIYTVDASSRLVVKTGKAGLFGFAGHTHLIRARTVTGELVYRPGGPKSSLRLRVLTDSLEVLTPPDTAEIRKVTEAMRTDVLHVDRFPTMTFAADAVDAQTGKVGLQLAVTMEGVTRTLPMTAEVTIGADTIRATGAFTAKQTDFGIKPFSGGPAGTVKVADKVTFCFDLVAVRRGAGPGGPRALGSASAATGVPGCVDNAKTKAEAERRPL
ncbi:MAG TPA: YceI family protein [Nonomuraea sp.]|nr:YceI family protein [Nonomuraea sp.]